MTLHKVGRPTLPDKYRREVVTLRLSFYEHAAYQKAAAAKGLSLSEWIRKMLDLHVEIHNVEASEVVSED